MVERRELDKGARGDSVTQGLPLSQLVSS